MAKEHKKLYKAGKNWIVATLTATTITLLGGIAYTAHADTTIEGSQDVQTTSVNQTNQVDNSNDSVTINQPVAVQSSQPAQSAADAAVATADSAQSAADAAIASAQVTSDAVSAIASATAEAKAGANDAIIRAKSAWDVAVQSSQPAQNDLSVQGNQTNQTVPSSATAAADTSNSDSLDSNIYGTVNVKDWDYQNDSNTFNLTSYHGQDTRHIIVPNLNDFDNAGVKIGNATGVGITSKLARSLASQSLAFAISKTSGKYSDKVTATDNDWSSVFSSTGLINADLSNLDTRNITDMNCLFAVSTRLKTVGNLSHWDTSNVTDMAGMFIGYNGAIGDLSHWDTSNVRDMSDMFSDYNGVIGDLSHWDTSNVTAMDTMFAGSSASVSGLNTWKTRQPTNMSMMFTGSSLPYKIVASNEGSVIPNQVTLKDNTGKFLAIIDTPTIYDSNKSVRSTIDGIVQAEIDKLNKLNHTSYETPKIISDGDDDYSIANATYVVNNESQSKTGLINYVDQDGKVVKTDQVSGKVGDQINVKLSLPDGYELANKDEQIPSSITVGEDGINTITIQVKKLPVVQTTDWQKNANNQWVYNGKTDQDLKGTQYVQLPTIPDTNVQGNTNWYFVKDGIAQSGVQQWAGTYYYFDPTTYLRVDNDYRQSQWGDWYMFGKDGRIATGLYKWDKNNQWYYFNPTTYLAVTNNYIQANDGHWYLFTADGTAASRVAKWAGTYYYFDPVTHLRVDNNYVQSQWGDWYLFGNDGRILSGVQQWAGTYYYFDPTTYLRVDDDYVTSQWGLKYMFGKDGRIATGLYKWDKNNQWYYFDPTTYLAVTNNYIQANDGHWYLFTADGTAASRVAKWAGTYYYFDPVTHLRVDNNYVQSQWGDWYMFGNDGRIITGRTLWYGNYYYFDPVTYLKVTNKWVDGNYYDEDGAQAISKLVTINNRLYYFDDQGKEISNQFRTIHGNTYYFGNDSAAVTGQQTIDGEVYKFSDYGYLLGNRYGKIENGKLNIYSLADNSLIKTVEAGPWENMAYSMDSNSINNIDGYISYTGWYRPYGTSQDGKTWYPTTVADWRPILMYVWPSKDVQVKFIQYFVNHGYENSNYGLTAGSVKDLSENTASIKLNEVAQNLRYVIEQHVVAAKSTSQLANDINNFITTIPELSKASELSVVNSYGYKPDNSGSVDDDQVIFVNNDSKNQKIGNTSYADSNYRLMNRTINNQNGDNNSDDSPELLVGNDIDNSNPVVQAENLNWEYFLLNYGKFMNYNPNGNFDGFRIDAADNIDADVLDQAAQLINSIYNTKGNQANANDHLIYNEGYHLGAANMLDRKSNPELYMDSGYFYTLENVLGRASDRDDINNLITNSIVNRQNDVSENVATPNWSFVTNHDQRKNLINQIVIDDHPGVADIMSDGYKAKYVNQAWKEFYADQARTDKKYTQYNLPAQYALLLTNKDTVPQVYYGDLYDETDQYMQNKSVYYDAITTLMKARKSYVSGGQSMIKINDHLLTSVRYGKGIIDGNVSMTDILGRNSGIAVVVGNDAQMANQTISINMGKAHANQAYKQLLGTIDSGLTSSDTTIYHTDSNGVLNVTVKGYSNPYVSGYLGVWVPLNGGANITTKASEVTNQSDKTYSSNAALDSHVIYEDFSLFQPEPTSKAEHAYNIIADNASLFNELGITDFWMAPAYTPFNMSRYNEGYSMTDRYNLGTEANPTKYGSGEELSNAIAALHDAGLKVQEDLVMNQMIGFSGQEAVTVTRTDSHTKQLTVDGKKFANQIYFAYTRGGGEGQKNYGGKYLDELQKKYPELFTTKTVSTGVAPDPSVHITEWSAKYQNGTSLQNIGIGLAVKLANGDYAYLNDSNNKAFNTTLPETMSSADYYANIEDD